MNDQIAVIGLGTMGFGIAQVFATAGCRVRCFDVVPAARASVKARINQSLDRMANAGLVEQGAIAGAMDRIEVTDTEAAAVTGATTVIEAVAEDLATKQQLVARLEAVVAPTTIIATNTSSLRLADIAANARHPERFVVMHWFNPAQIVPVVEVVPGPATSAETMDATVELLARAGKRPVRLSREVPGFIVNRVQVALLREVMDLLEQGIASADDIDAALRGSIGFRLAASGPLEVCDFGGLDIWKRVYGNLALQIRSDTTLPRVLADRVDAGDLGAKSGKGFYDYGDVDLPQKQAAREARLLELLKVLYG